MEEPNIVITHRVHPEILEFLRPYGRIFHNNSDQSLAQDELTRVSKTADALMVFMPDRIDRALLSGCARLKIVACALKGYDNIDVDACTERGVWVSIIPDLLSAPTADLAVSLLLALTRNILPGDRFVRSGGFRGWRPLLYGCGLEKKTAGVVGFGRVGQLIARRLRAFDMRVCYSDPAGIDEAGAEAAGIERLDLDQLVMVSDYLLLAASLNPSSFHLFSKDRLTGIKPGAFLINVGRGSVVDETAVAEALKNGRLAGYAADVYELEDRSRIDPPDSIPPLLLTASDRTVLTPHLGSAVGEVRLAIEKAAAANIIDVLECRSPRGAVNLNAV